MRFNICGHSDYTLSIRCELLMFLKRISDDYVVSVLHSRPTITAGSAHGRGLDHSVAHPASCPGDHWSLGVSYNLADHHHCGGRRTRCGSRLSAAAVVRHTRRSYPPRRSSYPPRRSSCPPRRSSYPRGDHRTPRRSSCPRDDRRTHAAIVVPTTAIVVPTAAITE